MTIPPDLIADTEAWLDINTPELHITVTRILRRWLDYARTAEPAERLVTIDDVAAVQLARSQSSTEPPAVCGPCSTGQHSKCEGDFTLICRCEACYGNPNRSPFYVPPDEPIGIVVDTEKHPLGLTVRTVEPQRPEGVPEGSQPVTLTEKHLDAVSEAVSWMRRNGTATHYADRLEAAFRPVPQPEPTLHVGGRAVWNDEGGSLEVELLTGPVKGSWSVLDDVGELDVANTDDLTPLPDEDPT